MKKNGTTRASIFATRHLEGTKILINLLSVYYDYGLMPKGKTIMAHCIHSTDEELNMLKEQQVMIAHCPQSNAKVTNLTL